MSQSPNSNTGRILAWLKTRPNSVAAPTELEAYVKAYSAFQTVGTTIPFNVFADSLRIHGVRPQQRRISPAYESPPRFEYVLALGPAGGGSTPQTGTDLPAMVEHWLRTRGANSNLRPVVGCDAKNLTQNICQCFRQSHHGYAVNDADILDSVASAMGFDGPKSMLASARRTQEGWPSLVLAIQPEMEPVA